MMGGSDKANKKVENGKKTMPLEKFPLANL